MNILFQTAYAQAANQAGQVQSQTQEGIGEFFQDFLAAIPLWIAAFLVFMGSYFVAKIISKLVVHKIVAKSNYSTHQEVNLLIERMVYVGIILLGLIISFKIVGIDIATIIGFIGLGLGFALKDLLANFIAGVVILTQSKFKIGDVVRVKDKLGTVIEIETRTTEIKTFDGVILIIPNAEMLTSIVENLTTNEFRRFEFQIGVHYDTPLADAIQLTLDVIKRHEGVMPEPGPVVIATEFSDSAITLVAKFWVENGGQHAWWKVQSDLIQAIKVAYDEAGICIPFPIRTLNLDPYDKNLLEATHVKNGVPGYNFPQEPAPSNMPPQTQNPVQNTPAPTPQPQQVVSSDIQIDDDDLSLQSV